MPEPERAVPLGTLLIDWDNTLHDAAGTFFRALRDVLRQRNLEVDEPAYRAAYDPDYRVLYARLGLPADEVAQASAEWRALVREAEPRLLPGAREALARLHASGMPAAIVTGAPRAQVERQLAALDLAWPPVAVAAGEAAAPRPDPAPLLLARVRLARVTEPVLYAGDTPADMRMARAAGVRGIGIAAFATDEARLRDAGASETAPSFGDWLSRWLAT